MATLREQFIERLVREIFLKKGSGFVLKGGGAIRAMFGEQRLTKDIDLDFINPKRTADSLHNTVNRAIAAAAQGLPVRDLRVSTPGKGERTPRWKINFNDPDGRTFHIEVEISRDPERAVPADVIQKSYVPLSAKGIARFWVDIYAESGLIASKLAALLGREVPRDVYDLDLLIGSAQRPSHEQIQWAIKRAGLGLEQASEVLASRLTALTWDRYQAELRDALPEHIVGRIDETEWEALKRRVGDYAESLLSRQVESPQ